MLSKTVKVMRDLMQLAEMQSISTELYMVMRLTEFTNCLEIIELQDGYQFPAMTNFKITNYRKDWLHFLKRKRKFSNENSSSKGFQKTNEHQGINKIMVQNFNLVKIKAMLEGWRCALSVAIKITLQKIIQEM